MILHSGHITINNTLAHRIMILKDPDPKSDRDVLWEYYISNSLDKSKNRTGYKIDHNNGKIYALEIVPFPVNPFENLADSILSETEYFKSDYNFMISRDTYATILAKQYAATATLDTTGNVYGLLADYKTRAPNNFITLSTPGIIDMTKHIYPDLNITRKSYRFEMVSSTSLGISQYSEKELLYDGAPGIATVKVITPDNTFIYIYIEFTTPQGE